MKSVGLIGFGSFGRFLASHLVKHAQVYVHDPLAPDEAPTGMQLVSLEKAAAQPVVILAVPVSALEELLPRVAEHVQPEALIVDVASVKMKPVMLMERHLPDSVSILATHPLFGPESGKAGIAGLKVVVHPVRMPDELFDRVVRFLEGLELKVLKIRPEEHDREMAYVQGLTFFIGEALKEMGIPNEQLNTETYKHLLEIKFMSERHSPELFETMERDNPFAATIRQALVLRLAAIDRDLQQY